MSKRKTHIWHIIKNSLIYKLKILFTHNVIFTIYVCSYQKYN